MRSLNLIQNAGTIWHHANPYHEISHSLFCDLGATREIQFIQTWTVLGQSNNAFISKIMNTSQGYHDELGTVNGNLTHTKVCQVTVPETDLHNARTVRSYWKGNLITNRLETSHSQYLQIGTVLNNSLDHIDWQLYGKDGFAVRGVLQWGHMLCEVQMHTARIHVCMPCATMLKFRLTFLVPDRVIHLKFSALLSRNSLDSSTPLTSRRFIIPSVSRHWQCLAMEVQAISVSSRQPDTSSSIRVTPTFLVICRLLRNQCLKDN